MRTPWSALKSTFGVAGVGVVGVTVPAATSYSTVAAAAVLPLRVTVMFAAGTVSLTVYVRVSAFEPTPPPAVNRNAGASASLMYSTADPWVTIAASGKPLSWGVNVMLTVLTPLAKPSLTVCIGTVEDIAGVLKPTSTGLAEGST